MPTATPCIRTSPAPSVARWCAFFLCVLQLFAPQWKALAAPLPEDLSRLFEVTNKPHLTGMLAFTVSVNDIDRVLTLDLASGVLHAIADVPGSNSYAAWSPDGRKLAFTSDRSGTKQIYVADWDGNNSAAITSGKGDKTDPSWTHDGRAVVFAMSEPGDQDASNIALVDLSSLTVSPLTRFKGKQMLPKAAPDGSAIVYTTNRFWPGWDVCLWDLQKGFERCVLQGKDSYCRASWSHVGVNLAFSQGSGANIELWKIDIATGERTRVPTDTKRAYDPEWSPDDKFLMFSGERDRANIFELDVVNGDGDVLPVVQSQYSIRHPSWSAKSRAELLKPAAKQ